MRKTIRNIMKKGYCACDPRFEMWEDSPSEAYNIFKGNRNYLRLDNCKGKGYITLKLD